MRGRLQGRDIGFVAARHVGRHRAAIQVGGGKGGLGQHALSLLLRDAVAEHHGPAPHGLGEQAVVVHGRAQFFQLRRQAGHARQFALRQSLQHGVAGTGVRFGKRNIEAQRGHAVMPGELAHQARLHIAAPGKTAHAGQALLIDVDNDDTAVELRRFRAHAPVAQHGIEAGNILIPGKAQHGRAHAQEHAQQAARPMLAPGQRQRHGV
ncbi:hypothetical protein D3C72_1572860 [compost metagenome]